MDKNFYAKIIQDSPIGFAYHKVSFDENNSPIDYTFIEINEAFEKNTKMKADDILGKNVSEIFTGQVQRVNKWLSLYGRVALTGESEEFEEFSPELMRWFKIHLSSPKKDYVVSQVVNITGEMEKLRELERLKNELEQAEEKYKIISEYSFDWEVWEGLGAEVLYISPACEKICGYSREHFYRKKSFLLDLIIDEDKEIWENHQHYTNNGINRVEFRIRHKNGKLVWIQHSCCPVYGADSNHLGFRSNNRDITEMKQAEKKIREEQAQFEKVIENLPFCLTIITLEGTVLYVNEKGLSLFGMGREVIGTNNTFLAWVNPEKRKEWLKELGEKGLVKDFEMEVRSTSGKCFWTMGSGIIINYQGQKCVLSTQHDITERKMMEQALQESEKKYKNLFENAVETVLVMQDKKIMISNPVASELTGYSQKELAALPFKVLIYPADLATVEQMHENRLKTDYKNKKNEFRIIRKSGEIRWVESDGIKIDWEGRDAILNFVVDITERKLIQDDLKRSEEKYRFLTEFASDVIWILNLNQMKYTYVSPAISQLRGLSVSEALAEKPEQSLTEESYQKISRLIDINAIEFNQNPDKSTYYINEVQQPCKDGRIIWVEISSKFRYNGMGEIEIIGVSRNIEERKKAEEDILFLSYRDQLTELYNRRFYEEAVIRMNTLDQLPLTLVMADVNGLKMTNDAFGHLVGDKLLKEFAAVLKETSRKNDLVARIGGDEFVLLLPNTDEDSAQKIIGRIQAKIKNRKVENILISVSFGYSTKRTTDESIEKIFSEAEDLMYRKKLLESKSMKNKMIQLIVKSLYERSNPEKGHGERVSALCKSIGEAMGFSSDEVDDLGLLGLVHDIGKIAISEEILNKEEELNEIEWMEIRKHPEIGYQILRSVSEFAHISDFVLSHHERIDGMGYPRNLKAEEIPVESKILSIAEAYDSMVSGLSKKERLTPAMAIKELKRFSGLQFDPKITKIFISKVLLAKASYKETEFLNLKLLNKC